MQDIYLVVFFIILTIPKNMYYGTFCERCCTNQEYIHFPKVFSDASENGAADVAIRRLKMNILNFREVFDNNRNNNILDNLKKDFIRKEQELPQASKELNTNRLRLAICNECFIINELIVLLTKCYNNYDNFLKNKGTKILTSESFKTYFERFVAVCELMIKESLAEYKIVEESNKEENLLTLAVANLSQDNPFALIETDTNDYNINDTTNLRNKIGELFNQAFGVLMKYKLRQTFNKQKENISNDDIKNIDGLTL